MVGDEWIRKLVKCPVDWSDPERKKTKDLSHSGLIQVFGQHKPFSFDSKFDNFPNIEVVKYVIE